MSAKKFIGKVVSNKMINTVVVAVEMPKRHPIYMKIMKNTRRIKAHVTKPVGVGSTVEIMETKPYSRFVSFKVLGEVKET